MSNVQRTKYGKTHRRKIWELHQTEAWSISMLDSQRVGMNIADLYVWAERSRNSRNMAPPKDWNQKLERWVLRCALRMFKSDAFEMCSNDFHQVVISFPCCPGHGSMVFSSGKWRNSPSLTPEVTVGSCCFRDDVNHLNKKGRSCLKGGYFLCQMIFRYFSAAKEGWRIKKKGRDLILDHWRPLVSLVSLGTPQLCKSRLLTTGDAVEAWIDPGSRQMRGGSNSDILSRESLLGSHNFQ